MNLNDLRNEILDVDMLDVHHPVRVLDEDGFQHDLLELVWSEEDSCYFIRVRYYEVTV